MATAPNLRVRISADLNDIKQGLGLLRGELAKVKQQAAAAMPNLGSNAAVAGIRRLRTEVAGFVAAYASLRGVGVLTAIADEATQVRGRIRAAKGDYQALLQIAQETRSGIAATTDLYARMERSTRSMGVSQERLLGLTRSINQAIRLSFTTTAAGEAAVMQFGQALAAGELRGQELNSVLEQTPRLAEAVAAGMGMQVGQLKSLAKEGKLTAEQVLKAVETQAGAISREFSQMPVTIGDAMTQVRNSFVDYIGNVDAASGASRKFAQALQGVAQDLPRYLDPVLSAFRLLLENLDLLAVYMVTRFAGAAIPAVVVGVMRLVTILKAATTATITLRTVMMALGGPVGIAIAALTAGIYALYRRTTEAKRAADEHRKAMDETREMARHSAAAAYEDARAKRAQAISTLQAALAAAQERKERLAEERERQDRVGGRSSYLQGGVVAAAGTAALEADTRVEAAAKRVEDLNKLVEEMRRKSLVETALQDPDPIIAPGSGAAEAGKALAASNALMRDQVSRAIAELDRLYKANDIGMREYFAARQQLQERAIDLQLEQARNQLAVTKDAGKRRDLEEQITILLRDRGEVGAAAARDLAEAEKGVNAQLAEMEERLLAARGEPISAKRLELAREFQDWLDRLPLDAREAGRKLVEELLPIELAKLRQQEISDNISRITGQLSSTESSISAQVNAGMLGYVEGETRLREARLAAMRELAEQISKQHEAMSMLEEGSPEHTAAMQGLNALEGAFATVAASADVFRNQVQDAATNALTDLFMDLVEGTKSAGEALRDFVRGFALAMAQIAARALATFLVLKMLDAIYPGLGKATAAMMNAGQNHTGGKAGKAGGVIRQVPAGLVSEAPRYHGGGVAGVEPGSIKHNEVVSVLERGETIRTKQQESALQGQLDAGSGRVVVKTPIVAIGDRAIADGMASAAGEEVILTVVRNNWTGLSRG